MIERITRSLAFMLRHQPEQFDLVLDAEGYADVGEVIRALNERLGEPVREEDLTEAVSAGDRARYEIQDGKIRALYGHSIPVEPGAPSKPPETLYVAIPERDLERARRFGLRGGRRRFLHLALTESDARESGRRAARQYTVLSVRALDAWEEGINFYDRSSLWLAEEVPTNLLDKGETYDDGTDPSHGRGRPDVDRGRDGGSRGRGRGGTRSRGRSRGSEHGRDSGRDPGRDLGGRSRDSRDQRDQGPREARPAPEVKRERKERTREVSTGGSSFGAGLADAKHAVRKAPAASKKPARKSKKREAPRPAPDAGDGDGGSFGAGL